MAAVGEYDVKAIVVVFGNLQLSGFADGTFVVAERAGPAFVKYVGADGEVARARNRDRSGTITVTLAQTSIYNALLSEIAALDEELGTGKKPFLVKDLLGTTLCQAEAAWIQKVPSAEFGKEIGPREWVFDTGPLKVFNGGGG